MLPVVRTVEAQMAADMTLNHEYLPVAGSPEYRQAAARLLLGDDSPAITQNKVLHLLAYRYINPLIGIKIIL